MTDSYQYSPESVNATLRSWYRYVSLAEGIGTSVPDAHRHGKGQRYDALQHADRIADIEYAMAKVLVRGGLQWRTVMCVQEGRPLRSIGVLLKVRTDNVLKAYDLSCAQIASFLGWEPPEDEPT